MATTAKKVALSAFWTFAALAAGSGAAALTWPADVPAGETAGGKFMSLMQKAFVDANPATSDWTVKKAQFATALTQSCASGQAIQGFSSTGSVICSAASSGGGSSSGGSPAVVTTVPAPATDTGSLGTITSAITDFNGGGLPFELQPRCDLDPAVYNSARGLCIAKRLAGKTFVRNVVIDGWDNKRFVYSYYVKFSQDGMYAYGGSYRTPGRNNESDYQKIKYVQTPPIYSPIMAATVRSAINSTGIKGLVPSGLALQLYYQSFTTGVANPYWGYNRIEFTDPGYFNWMNQTWQDYLPTTNWPDGYIDPVNGRTVPLKDTAYVPKYCYNPEIANSYDESIEVLGKGGRATSQFSLSGDAFANTLKVSVQPDVTSPVQNVSVSSRDTFVTTDHYVCSDTLSGSSTLPGGFPPVPTN